MKELQNVLKRTLKVSGEKLDKKTKKSIKKYDNGIWKELMNERKELRKERKGNWYYTYGEVNKQGKVIDKLGTTCKYIGLSNQCYRKYSMNVK